MGRDGNRRFPCMNVNASPIRAKTDNSHPACAAQHSRPGAATPEILIHSEQHRQLQPRGIRTVQGLLRHNDVSTTMICTHVLKVAAGGAASPLDALQDRNGRSLEAQPQACPGSCPQDGTSAAAAPAATGAPFVKVSVAVSKPFSCR